VRLPDSIQVLRKYRRMVERGLQRDRRSLLAALEEFANMRPDAKGWAHFRRRWPNFFPQQEYEKLVAGLKPSIFDYPYWLHQIWIGGETVPCFHILLGIDPNPALTEGAPEDAWFSGLISLPPKRFLANWEDGNFDYEGGCDFQRALYLLFQESWRARVCEKCATRFIARRAAQKYCSKECVGTMQRELKRKWWGEHGETWRQQRKATKSKGKGRKNVTHKTR
jgi:hypothetical protein